MTKSSNSHMETQAGSLYNEVSYSIREESDMIQAVFFDIDGTLVSFQTHRVSPTVLDGLRQLQEKGIKLFIATGRQWEAAAAAVGSFPFDGYITVNGQYCFAGDKVLLSNPVPRENVAQLIGLLEETGAPCIFLEGRRSYTVNPSPRLDLFPEQLNIPIPPVVPLREMLDHTFYQAVAFFTKEEQQAAGSRFFPGLDVFRWHPAFVDIVAPGGGKDRGMDAVLEHFGISLEETMAFGDGENDLPMLRHAHIGVALGNADDFVQSQADYVTDTVDEDGVLTALEHFGLL